MIVVTAVRRAYLLARRCTTPGSLATGVLLFSTLPAAANDTAPFERARLDAVAGRYLAAIDELREAAAKPDGDAAGQLLQQVEPFVTGELPVATPDPPSAGQRAQIASIAAAHPRDAIAEIVARANSTRVVILNEAHYSPRDRAFALTVARALRPLGYSILAAETFDNGSRPPNGRSPMEQLRRDGFVRLGTGFYTLDPVYATYVREALRLGYRPEAYEWTEAQQSPGAGVPEREQAQAENLAALVRAYPDAKFLVHVGHGHVWEGGSLADGTMMMAARLARLTGIDPLTIDQTQVTDLKGDRAALHAAAAKRLGARPAVLIGDAGPLTLNVPAGRHVDLQIVHPARAYRLGRPSWLSTLGGRPRSVPARLAAHGCTRLIQAFAAAAPVDAVPLDQVLATPGRPVPTLLVPPGLVRFAVQESASCGGATPAASP